MHYSESIRRETQVYRVPEEAKAAGTNVFSELVDGVPLFIASHTHKTRAHSVTHIPNTHTLDNTYAEIHLQGDASIPGA